MHPRFTHLAKLQYHVVCVVVRDKLEVLHRRLSDTAVEVQAVCVELHVHRNNICEAVERRVHTEDQAVCIELRVHTEVAAVCVELCRKDTGTFQ